MRQSDQATVDFRAAACAGAAGADSMRATTRAAQQMLRRATDRPPLTFGFDISQRLPAGPDPARTQAPALEWEGRTAAQG
jgi:hypothetical protein